MTKIIFDSVILVTCDTLSEYKIGNSFRYKKIA